MNTSDKIPLEIERKFIIKLADAAILEKEKNHTSSEILQIYLESSDRITHRIRKRTYENRSEYTETKKIRIDKMTVIEDEHEISAAEFASLKENIKQGTKPIIKTRHTFEMYGFTFEIDIYPEWKHTAVMEIELEDKNTIVKFPNFITVIKEVTGERAYSNASMSYNFPKELEF